MSAQHTPGRLVADGTVVFFSSNAGGFDIRDCPSPEENARRLVACWNACEPIADPANVVPRLLMSNERVPELESQVASLIAQRDELLAALKSLVEDLELRSSFKTGSQKNVVDCGNGVYLQAKNAITKAEGGAA
jgi:hypothetical protein